MPPPTISIIVSTYNQPAALDRIIAGLLNQTTPPAEILIADDGSRVDTAAVIQRHQAQRVVAIKHCWHEDQGFRKTIILNQAIAIASQPYIVFLDGDCVPSLQFIADHARLAEAGFFVQGRRAFIKESAVLDFVAGRVSLLGLAFSGRLSGLFKAVRFPCPIVRINQGQRGLIGCNLAIWRDDLVAVNGFDEAYAGWGMEDSDLCSRLYHLGRQRKFVHGRALVYHLNHPVASRAKVQTNQARLAQVLASRSIRCEAGLNQHRLL
jgi:glycosyltransferase involved in cell wall biosynthesis